MLLKRLLFLTLLFCFAAISMSQTSEKESNLKAAFIYNFTKYINWNKPDNRSDFVIGVIGDSPIIESLDEIAKTHTVNNKRIVVKSFNNLSQLDQCDILFIPKDNTFPLESILRNVGNGVLTISEQPGFAKRGTTFNFTIVNNKLKFEANLHAINDANLKVSSQLLKLATIVD